MILSAPDKQLKDQENRINKLDLEGELVHLYINVFLGSAWQSCYASQVDWDVSLT